MAIKTVNRNGLSQKLFENLRGEIEILKNLSHRHITRLLDLVVSYPCLPPHSVLRITERRLCFVVWRTKYIPHHRVLRGRRSIELHQEAGKGGRAGVCTFAWCCSDVLSTSTDGRAERGCGKELLETIRCAVCTSQLYIIHTDQIGVARALKFLRKKTLIHRDLKPQVRSVLALWVHALMSPYRIFYSLLPLRLTWSAVIR